MNWFYAACLRWIGWPGLLLWIPGLLYAQQPALSLTHLSVENGLSNATINCILQDKRGFMWFATNDGLNRYDGHTFTVFRPDTTRPTRSFVDNRITSVYEDRQGGLWATTAGGGLHEINPLSGQITAHVIRGAQAGQLNNQLSICQDSRGQLWLGTWGGLVRYEPTRRHFTLYASPRPHFVVKQVIEDQHHRLWLATNEGLYQFDRQTGQYTQVTCQSATKGPPNLDYLYFDPQDATLLWVSSVGQGLFQLRLADSPLVLRPFITRQGPLNPFLFIHALQRDQQGRLWVGTTDGVQRVDPVSRQLVTYRPNPNQRDGLSSTHVQAVYIDRSGTLWLGTNNGVDKQLPTATMLTTYQVTPASQSTNLFENRASMLLIDRQQQLWFSNAHVLYRLNRQRNQLSSVPDRTLGSTPQQINFICSLVADQSSGVWLNTSRGLYYYDPRTDRYTTYPWPVLLQHTTQSQAGTIWLGGEGGLASFDTHTRRYTSYAWLLTAQTGLAGHPVETLLASRSGQVWLAFQGYGLVRFSPNTRQYRTYRMGTARGQLTDDVLALYEDKQGVLWAGTNQGGLQRYEPATDQFHSVTTHGGLPTNRIVSIIGDERGGLWLGTDQGLCRYEPRTGATYWFDTRDGLPSNEFLPTAVVRNQRQLLFGTLNGIVAVDPDRLRPANQSFPIYLTGMAINNKPHAFPAQPLQLTHDQNMIAFEFVALPPRSPAATRYTYQLVGLDKGWLPAGNRRFANYTNLRPGDYCFQVRALSSDGVWSRQPVSYRFIIQPPWWATGWAYAGYVICLLGAGWVSTRLYSQYVHRRQALKLNQQKLDQLQEVEQLKTLFFTNVTHELRTPLTLVLTPVETLLHELAGTPHARMLATVQRNAQQLLTLINQLLDLARLEARQLPVHLSQGSLNQFIEEVIAAFNQSASTDQVRIDYQTSLTSDYWFDAEKLDRILTNLLANAIRFTPPAGQIQVKARATATGVELTVTDTGIGIAAEHIPFLFDRFYQAPPLVTTRPNGGGSGLGLALVQELVVLQGGQITVSSELTVGTTFRVELPYQVAPPTGATAIATAQQLPTPNEPTDGGSATVLVIDDNDDMAELVSLLLTPTHQVQRAANGALGLQQAIDELPDLIITDLMMPVMDGLELVQALKADERTRFIPVIMLTAKASVDSRLAGLSTGADDYLTKPFHPQELLLRVRNLLLRQRQLRDRLQTELIAVGSSDAPILPVENPLLQRTYELIEARLDDPTLSVEHIAEHLNLSRSSVHRRFKAMTGLPATELIRRYRLRRATQLLSQGFTSSETAYAVGFESPAYFSRCFREQYKVTPLEYARRPAEPPGV